MRIWITGANGFTGRFFVHHARTEGLEAELIGIDVSSEAAADVDRYSSLDIADFDSVAALAADITPTHVLHCAASIFEQDFEHMWRVNVQGTASLLQGLAAGGAAGARVLSVGSAAEYALIGSELIGEDARVGPASPYGKTKLAQTMLALSLGASGGFDVVVARTFNLIGPGLSSSLAPGAIAERVAAAGGGSVNVSDVDSTRDFVDVRDAVAAYWSLLRDGRPGEIYNVCTGVAVSVGQLAEAFAAQAGCSINAIDADWDPTHVVGSNRKLVEDTGWSPKIDLETSSADMLKTLQ